MMCRSSLELVSLDAIYMYFCFATPIKFKFELE
jgi:hypothetical protein